MFALPAAGQARRASFVQHAPTIGRGELLVGLGIGRAVGGKYPLAGFEGDLWSLGHVSIVYGLGEHASLSVRGDVWRVLSIETASVPSLPLDPGTADGTTSDAGDFEIALAFAPLGDASGIAGGALIEIKLPNSDETRGIGPNTTDVTLALLGSWGGGPWRATGILGIGILEAPLESFEQNDVVVYRFEGQYQVTERLGLSAGLAGHASTRSHVAVGTEDTGQVRLAVDWNTGPLTLDIGLAAGLAGISPDWRWSGGVAWRPRRGRP